MGSNKATLDYFDYATGLYTKNIFEERNPDVVKSLGDVGNDIQIYGDKLYAVINCSNLVEVMDLSTAVHITQISIANCRYITFDGAYAYVTSYAGPVQIDPNAREGYVAKIDTATMSVVDSCTVGYQPDELVIANGRIYVANSGGYLGGDYDNRVSVIDLSTFEVVNEIEVGMNSSSLLLDPYNRLWVSSRGNYSTVSSSLYVVDLSSEEVIEQLDVPCSRMELYGDSIYLFSNAYTSGSAQSTISYAIIDLTTLEVVDDMFIKDGTESDITIPYGLAINTEADELFITDAKDYITPGMLHCYDIVSGVRKWSVETGDIPAHIAFTTNKLEDDDTSQDEDEESTPDEPTSSAYITQIFDFCPAPGQYVNEMPLYEDGDTQESMNAKVLAAIGTGGNSMISLGGYGGYVVAGFDHRIENREGYCDFRVHGNAFINTYDTGLQGGSCEPGIIMVSLDSNGNGLPDDEWYEIEGSAHADVTQELWYQQAADAGNDVNFYSDYQITYSRSDSSEEIAWSDNKSNLGVISQNIFHTQPYYPQWIESDELTFSGSRLPQNSVPDDSGIYVLYKFLYGYADNDTDSSDASAIDISWAIDSNGERVSLSGIDFVKVYCGVNQVSGSIGELSTEVSGISDLHLLGESIVSQY